MKKFVAFITVVLLFGSIHVAAAVVNENEKNADAQYEIGMKYLEGNGVGQNYVQAYNWFKKAAL